MFDIQKLYILLQVPGLVDARALLTNYSDCVNATHDWKATVPKTAVSRSILHNKICNN